MPKSVTSIINIASVTKPEIIAEGMFSDCLSTIICGTWFTPPVFPPPARVAEGVYTPGCRPKDPMIAGFNLKAE